MVGASGGGVALCLGRREGTENGGGEQVCGELRGGGGRGGGGAGQCSMVTVAWQRVEES